MLTQLTTDFCCILKHNVAHLDNDVFACYDQIIKALEMLAARRFGMPESAVQTHTDCLKLMKYTVRTVRGIFNSNYHRTTFDPMYGTGQGRGALPSMWLTLEAVLMNTLDQLMPERMSFQSPDSSLRHDREIVAFIDITLLGFTNPGLITLETVIANSGDALNLSKCSWYTIIWDWKN